MHGMKCRLLLMGGVTLAPPGEHDGMIYVAVARYGVKTRKIKNERLKRDENVYHLSVLNSVALCILHLLCASCIKFCYVVLPVCLK